MSAIYTDIFNGTGDLDGRTPNVGVPLTAPTVDFGDGVYLQDVGDSLLTAMQLDGAGAVQMNDTIAVSGYVIAKVAPGVPDYAVEIVVRATPGTDTGYISVYGRTSPELANAPDGVNYIGGYFSFGGAGVMSAVREISVEGTSGSGPSATTPADYPAGPYDIVLRVEFEGIYVRFFVDGTNILTTVISDPELLVDGDVYIIFEPTSFTANLSDMEVLQVTVTTYPEVSGDFWTTFVKTHEVDV